MATVTVIVTLPIGRLKAGILFLYEQYGESIVLLLSDEDISLGSLSVSGK